MAKRAIKRHLGTPRRKYKRNFLSQVIARVDFATIPSIANGGPPAQVSATLKKSFPYHEQKKQLIRALTFTGARDTAEQQSQETFQWFYYSENRDKTVHIAGDCMYVEYKKYKTFEGFRRDFLTALNALFAAFPDLQVIRFGLRYVDTIDLNERKPTDWSVYLNPKLLAIFRLADDRSTISRAFQVLEFNYGAYNMRFQFGMLNADQFPAPIRKKVFTLDYDAYCQSLLTHDEITTYMDDFHLKINKSFEEVITDGLRRKMGIQND
jgi:uncharacterized protein (TIGR04255 family)